MGCESVISGPGVRRESKSLPGKEKILGLGGSGGRSIQVIGGCWESLCGLREGCAFLSDGDPTPLPAQGRHDRPRVPGPSGFSAKPLLSSVLGSTRSILMRPRSLLNECPALVKASEAFTRRKEFHYYIFPVLVAGVISTDFFPPCMYLFIVEMEKAVRLNFIWKNKCDVPAPCMLELTSSPPLMYTIFFDSSRTPARKILFPLHKLLIYEIWRD